MDWTGSVLVVVAVLIFLFQAFTWRRRAKSKRLPPGPRGLPIIGNLLMIGNKPHRDLQQLSHKFGPIMHLRFGLMPVIVVSSPEAAELFLKTHDLVFASRPPLEASKLISYNQQDLLFSPYGSYWRNMRKMCTLELLSNHKINSFMSMRNEEVNLLIRYIREAASSTAGVAVDLTSKVSSFSMDITCRMIIGKKYDSGDFSEKGFESTIRDVMQVAAAFNLADYIPQIKGLDLQRLTKRMKSIAKDFDMFMEKIVEKHVQSKDDNRIKDFVDVMLGFVGSGDTEYCVERNSIKAVILDMIIASMDTSAAALDWTMSELIRHPRVTKELQKELENVVGMKRMVKESDLEKLEYLDMVLKESFRLHPVVPLLMHASREDCTVNDFHIPKNSRIFINTWAIGRDPSVWTDADKFYPERFVGRDIDLRGQNFELIPFGSGRRGCPGMQLGLTIVRLVIAQLVHCFDWELPHDMLTNELDMTEVSGLVSPRAKNLLAVPTWRLKA